MIYKIYKTKTGALNYAATVIMPKHAGDVTTTWDVPRELKNGEFAILSHDGEGEEIEKLDLKLGALDEA